MDVKPPSEKDGSIKGLLVAVDHGGSGLTSLDATHSLDHGKYGEGVLQVLVGEEDNLEM